MYAQPDSYEDAYGHACAFCGRNNGTADCNSFSHAHPNTNSHACAGALAGKPHRRRLCAYGCPYG